MLTYTGLRNLFGDLTLDDSSANLTLGDTLINEYTKLILASRNYHFLEGTDTINIVASTQSYQLTAPVRKVRAVKATISDTDYFVKECPTYEKWIQLNESSASTTFPEWWYLIGNVLYLYPTPASSATNGITVFYYKKHIDLSIADYTTGTIVTATNAAAAIVGDSSVWTAKMANQWLKITDSNTANTGDGQWYQITSITDATHLTLLTPYEGISIAAGSAAYTIGQCSLLPEDYHIMPVHRACEVYFTTMKPDTNRATMHKNLYIESKVQFDRDYGQKTSSPVIEDTDVGQINPNLTLTL